MGITLAIIAGILAVLAWKNWHRIGWGNISSRYVNQKKVAAIVVIMIAAGLLIVFWDDLHEKYQSGFIFGFLLLGIVITIVWLAGNRRGAKALMACGVVALFTVGYWGLADKSASTVTFESPAMAATTAVVAVPESLPRCGGADLELRTATRYKLSPDCALHLYSSEGASGSWYTLDENGAEIDDSQFLRIKAFDGGFGPDGSIRHGRVLSTPATSGTVYAVLVPGGSTDDRLYLNTARDSAPVE